MANNAFYIVGGDRRQLYLARSIAGDGWPVFLTCLEEGEQVIPGESLPSLELQELRERQGTAILPLPATRDGRTLNAPFCPREIVLDNDFAALFLGMDVYGGMTEQLRRTSPLWEDTALRDYYAREELTLGNAFLTAEGAIGVAIQEYEGALNGSRCLVTGFGRIGKALCLGLKGLGAQVDCCARKSEDLTAIRALGCGSVPYRALPGGYDVIFNTVPARVLGAPQLSRQRPDVLLIELASAPGGVDLEAARRLSLRVRAAPSLPGRMSPRTSGELIKEAVYNMMEET